MGFSIEINATGKKGRAKGPRQLCSATKPLRRLPEWKKGESGLVSSLLLARLSSATSASHGELALQLLFSAGEFHHV